MNFSAFILILISLFLYNFANENIYERIPFLDKLIESNMKLAKLKTVGIIIVNKTSPIFKKVYGETDKVSLTSPFILGSVSKSFTALGILKLNINLDQTLDKFDLKEYIDENDAKYITISELLNHTSGLDSMTRKITGKRGTFAYSNYGFALLGKIIEKVSKKTYHNYMKETIFEKLNMNNSYAEYNNEIIDSYDNFFGADSKYDIKYEIGDGFFVPAGFISASIDDMGQYCQLYLNPDDDINKITHRNLLIMPGIHYGMGMMIKHKNGRDIYEHPGTVTSFLSHLYIFPDLELAYFVVTNTHDNFCEGPANAFIDSIEDFLISGSLKEIDNKIFFFVHFTYDTIIIFIIIIPLIYLIITIVRIAKRKKYLWFNEIKGKIIFGIDAFILVIAPIITLICLFSVDFYLKRKIEYSKDYKFGIFTTASLMFLTFIIKLIYVFVYDKYLKKNEKMKNKDDMDLDYLNVNNEETNE